MFLLKMLFLFCLFFLFSFIITFFLSWMTLRGQKAMSESFDLKYLENGDRYDVGPHGALIGRHPWLSIGTIKFDLGRPWGLKLNVKILEVDMSGKW